MNSFNSYEYIPHTETVLALIAPIRSVNVVELPLLTMAAAMSVVSFRLCFLSDVNLKIYYCDPFFAQEKGNCRLCGPDAVPVNARNIRGGATVHEVNSLLDLSEAGSSYTISYAACSCLL